ncbi:ATP-binding protein [Streptomyces calvus]|jgi:anti-sigma regulatory factor (Ser/Thr protein kinase)|uniref:Anti-sigma regulatory factor (Ser/Thr protein kinase) n=1 Tax=Streptomyces calvus TaxID=67282 RepID=A0AA40SGW2_9ACTN|nr:ATP-binding protein [Streptomyces calvus]MBA8946286.1 anti-sigma regulatory factor (Ser/Thr protein kinase) [Streptomyces calvus]GGP49025.1 ATP-binding protein [Streptomyces calvus]
MPATATFRIPKHRRHVPTARQQVRKVLADWGVTGEPGDTVALLATELVTNAVTHCRVSFAQVRVTLTLSGAELVLEVADPDRDRLPRLHDPGPDEEGGRGLALVQALADDWGHRQEPYAKCVWARFTLTETARTDAPAAC